MLVEGCLFQTFGSVVLPLIVVVPYCSVTVVGWKVWVPQVIKELFLRIKKVVSKINDSRCVYDKTSEAYPGKL